MYKRPNAPFKPPRPLSTKSDVSAREPAKSIKKNYLSDTKADVSEVDSGQPKEQVTDGSNSPTCLRAYKRVRPNPKVSIQAGCRRLTPAVSRNVRSVSGASRMGLNTNDASDTEPSCDKSFELSDKSFDDCSDKFSGSTKPIESSYKKYYTVQWRKKSNKKNKSWEGDGFISVSDTGITLRIQISDASFKLVGRTKNTSLEGIIRIGIHEVEIDCETTKESLYGGKAPAPEDVPNTNFGGQSLITAAFKHHPLRKELTEDEPTENVSEMKTMVEIDEERTSLDANIVNAPDDTGIQPLTLPLVLSSTNNTDSKRVIVDERLTRFLRPHQREGVSFLWECVMGQRNKGHYGALLADEMGLGKTLMTITLIWTLLKQSPVQSQKNVVNKVLICCPVSLIDNWRKEFGKWLDTNRIGILALNNKNSSTAKEKQDILNFGKTKVYQVLIMNYEKVLACSSQLSTVAVDLLICDEGHRLKSATNKVLKFLAGMPVQRRVVLTGTPIQNDLNEFYNIVNFINPGLLGSSMDFQKQFLMPISKARDVNCFDSNTVQQGKEKSSLLIDITKSFTIRRTKAVIEDYLTIKTDLLVFCSPTKLQKSLFKFIIEAIGFSSLVGTTQVLPAINLLRRVCNSPSLLSDDAYYGSLVKKAGEIPPELMPSALVSRTTGSKMNVIIPLLLKFRDSGENTVLVSNYTQTLDLLERVLHKLNMSYARLDGSTPSSTRDALVSSFNKAKKFNVFLLSAKAGGVGLNLIGGSRLVLFDNDWNPSVDLQAMARVHRDGQQKPVFIYRLFTTGSIDEKIFQRQLMKNNLSDMFLDDNMESTSNIFGFEDLKDLFTVVETRCNTHDLLDCDCSGKGEEIDLSQVEKDDPDTDSLLSEDGLPASSPSGWMSASQFKEVDQSVYMKKQTIRSAMSHYKHFDAQHFEHQMDTGDNILNGLIPKASGDISFIFSHRKGRENSVVQS